MQQLFAPQLPDRGPLGLRSRGVARLVEGAAHDVGTELDERIADPRFGDPRAGALGLAQDRLVQDRLVKGVAPGLVELALEVALLPASPDALGRGVVLAGEIVAAHVRDVLAVVGAEVQARGRAPPGHDGGKDKAHRDDHQDGDAQAVDQRMVGVLLLEGALLFLFLLHLAHLSAGGSRKHGRDGNKEPAGCQFEPRRSVWRTDRSVDLDIPGEGAYICVAFVGA